MFSSPLNDKSVIKIKKFKSANFFQKNIDHSNKIQRKVVQISQQNLEQQIQTYHWRSSTLLPISRIFTYKIISGQSFPKISCSQISHYNKQKQIKLLISYQASCVKLFSCPILPLFQIIYMLKEAFVGFERLFDKFGWFAVNDRMIYVNKYNKCKVWMNQEYQNNHVQGQVKQYNQIDKVKQVRNILKLFQKKTLMSKNAVVFFRNVYQFENICEVLEFVNKFVQEYQIIIVKQVKINKNIQRNTTNQLTKNKLFLTRSINIKNSTPKQNKSNHQSLSPVCLSPYKQYFSNSRLEVQPRIIQSSQKSQSFRLGSLKSIPKFIVSKNLQQQKRNKLNLFSLQKCKCQQKLQYQKILKFQSQCQKQQQKQQNSNLIIQKSKLKVNKSKSLNSFINVFNGMKITKNDENNNRDNNNKKRDQYNYHYQVKNNKNFNNKSINQQKQQKRGSYECNRSQFTYKSFKSLKQISSIKNSPKVSFTDQIQSQLCINSNKNTSTINKYKLDRQPSITYQQVDEIHQQSYLIGKILLHSNHQNNKNQPLKSRIRKYSNNDTIKINNINQQQQQNNWDNNEQINENKINFQGIKIKSMNILASNKNIYYENDEEDNQIDQQLDIQNQFVNKIQSYHNNTIKQSQQQSNNHKLDHIKTSSQTAVTFYISKSKKTLHNNQPQSQQKPVIFSPSSDSKLSQLIQKNGWKFNISSLFDHNNNKNELKQSIKNYNNQYEEQQRSKQLGSTNDFLLLSKYGREIKSNNVSGIELN